MKKLKTITNEDLCLANNNPNVNLRKKLKGFETEVFSNYNKRENLVVKAKGFQTELFTNSRPIVKIDRGRTFDGFSKDEIVDIGLQYFRENKKLPSRSNLGVNRNNFEEEFEGGLSELHTIIGEKTWDTNEFLHIGLHKKKLKTCLDLNKPMYIITTACPNSEVCLKSLQTLMVYAKEKKAELVILIQTNKKTDQIFDSVLKSFVLLVDTHEIKIGNDLIIRVLRNNPKSLNPFTGVERLGERNVTNIFNNPKQAIQAVAVNPEDRIHDLWTTGAITKPNYKDSSYLQSNKQEELAGQDHVLGALIIEIKDGINYIKDIQFSSDGSFTHLGWNYLGQNGKLRKNKIKSKIVLGDLHSGKIDLDIKKATMRLCKVVKVDEAIIHDGFDGYSISHHIRNGKNLIDEVVLSEKGEQNLEKELRSYANILNELLVVVPKITLIRSNHDEWLVRWLNNKLDSGDKENFELWCELAVVYKNGKDPLEYALRKFGCVSKNVTVLQRTDRHITYGVEHIHGDKGANGGRGSLKTFGNAYSKSVFGHGHAPASLYNQRRVGNMMGRTTKYTEGFTSSWIAAHCILYENKTWQMIMIKDGNY